MPPASQRPSSSAFPWEQALLSVLSAGRSPLQVFSSKRKGSTIFFFVSVLFSSFVSPCGEGVSADFFSPLRLFFSFLFSALVLFAPDAWPLSSAIRLEPTEEAPPSESASSSPSTAASTVRGARASQHGGEHNRSGLRQVHPLMGHAGFG